MSFTFKNLSSSGNSLDSSFKRLGLPKGYEGGNSSPSLHSALSAERVFSEIPLPREALSLFEDKCFDPCEGIEVSSPSESAFIRKQVIDDRHDAEWELRYEESTEESKRDFQVTFPNGVKLKASLSMSELMILGGVK